jgi:uncharacterized protein
MPAQPTTETIAVYRQTMQRRQEQVERELARRRERALQAAEQASAFLKKQFGATEVILFGSLVHRHWFSQRSDIDLASRGIADDDYFVAVARLQDLSPEFKIDLVSLEKCKPELRQAIIDEGKRL